MDEKQTIYYGPPQPTQYLQPQNTLPSFDQIVEPRITSNARNQPLELNLGTLTDFVACLFFGFFVPITGPIAIFLLESSQLAKLGILLGNANAMTWLVSLIVSAYSPWPSSDTLWFWISLTLLIIAIILYTISIFLWRRYSKEYVNQQAGTVNTKVLSPPGTILSFIFAMIISFFVPIIGPGAMIPFKELRPRFGAMFGMSCSFVCVGLATAPALKLDYVTGNAFLFIGLPLLQITVVHFKRAIICSVLQINKY